MTWLRALEDMDESSLRSLTAEEQAVLNRLLEADFPGKKALSEQLAVAKVRQIDENGSLRFVIPRGPKAEVKGRVPVEAEALDTDGLPIYVLLHVVNGVLWELEIYKADSSRVLSPPSPEKLDLLIAE